MHASERWWPWLVGCAALGGAKVPLLRLPGGGCTHSTSVARLVQTRSSGSSTGWYFDPWYFARRWVRSPVAQEIMPFLLVSNYYLPFQPIRALLVSLCSWPLAVSVKGIWYVFIARWRVGSYPICLFWGWARQRVREHTRERRCLQIASPQAVSHRPSRQPF